MIGRTVSHYEIAERLGGGAMGEVFEALDTRLKRKVALKFLHREWSRDDQAKQRFMQEAQAASSLDHPNICVIHDIGETESGRTFIVMAFYEGETVRDKIARGPVPPEEAVSIASQLALGLAAAHRRGIVHRDIKPANLIVTKDGVVKIVDFGLAKLAGAVEITDAGTLLGTPAYMAPEQMRGGDVDGRADIWSVGVILHEMLTGERPFPGDTPPAIIHAILNTEPRAIDGAALGAMPGLAGVVRRALFKAPEQRFCSFEAMSDALLVAREGTESPTLILEGAAASSEPSIAVLPFVNMSADPEQEYFCDGMADEIIGKLSRIKGLHVVARTSAFAFKGRYADVRAIGQELSVRTVLEGSVRKSGSQLRISVRLVNATDGFDVWSARYDRELCDVFAVQDEISKAIVDALEVELLAGEAPEPAGRQTENIEAYELYLKGRFHWNKRSADGVHKGIEFFEKAIEIDPEYALAYAGLADSYIVLGYYGTLSPKETLPRAIDAAGRALAIDESLAEAETSLAFSRLLYDRDWEAAEAGFRRALELNPGYATAHHWYSEFLTFSARQDEAIEAALRALRLDPLSLIINTLVGWVWFYARRYGKAARALERTLELDENFLPARLWLGLAYERLGRGDEALATLECAVSLSSRAPFILSALGGIHARAGRRDEAAEILDELTRRAKAEYVAPYFMASVCGGLCDQDDVLGWLERSLEARDIWLLFLGIDPAWDNLRTEPRFIEMEKKVGLPDLSM